VPGPDNEVIESQLSDLVSPAVASQLAYYQQLGLRSRILNLPLMVASVLTILWQARDVSEPRRARAALPFAGEGVGARPRGIHDLRDDEPNTE